MKGRPDVIKLPRLSRKIWGRLLLHAIMILVLLVAMAPIALTVIISFKDQQDTIRKPPVLFPCDTATDPFDWRACRWSVEGYQRVLAPEQSDSLLGFRLAGRMFRVYIPNTLLYASATAVGVTILAGMSGFAFSRYRFRGRGLLLAAVLAITGVPLLTNILALYQMGVVLRNSPFPFNDRVYLIVVYLGFFLPLSVWIAKGFFDTIPRDLEEAALIDGASPLGALRYVTMPAALPGLAAIFLLTFVNVWNEFLAGYLLVSRNELKPVMFGLYDFLGANIINLQVIAAACILLALPMVVIFLFARRAFFMAMVEGAVKG
jgi:ABC-type glycerol-3-phosphate transport system permease component